MIKLFQIMDQERLSPKTSFTYKGYCDSNGREGMTIPEAQQYFNDSEYQYVIDIDADNLNEAYATYNSVEDSSRLRFICNGDILQKEGVNYIVSHSLSGEYDSAQYDQMI